MNEKLTQLLSELEGRIESLSAEIAENEEWKGDDFNPMDASGGNFDDAYSLGEEHGEAYGRYAELSNAIKSLKAVAE